jgi:hypothetical protein
VTVRPSAANVCAKETCSHVCETNSATSLYQLSVFLPGLGLLPQRFFILPFPTVLFLFRLLYVFVVFHLRLGAGFVIGTCAIKPEC